jgi:Flp pilus assembly protein TadD
MRAPDEEFDRLFVKGGEAITDGDMGKALAFFQRALQVDPTNEQTKAMVAKLSSLGIAPADISEDDPSGQDAVAR